MENNNNHLSSIETFNILQKIENNGNMANVFMKFVDFFNENKPKRKLNWLLLNSGMIIKYYYFVANFLKKQEIEVNTYQGIVLLAFNKDLDGFFFVFYSINIFLEY